MGGEVNKQGSSPLYKFAKWVGAISSFCPLSVKHLVSPPGLVERLISKIPFIFMSNLINASIFFLTI